MAGIPNIPCGRCGRVYPMFMMKAVKENENLVCVNCIQSSKKKGGFLDKIISKPSQSFESKMKSEGYVMLGSPASSPASSSADSFAKKREGNAQMDTRRDVRMDVRIGLPNPTRASSLSRISISPFRAEKKPGEKMERMAEKAIMGRATARTAASEPGEPKVRLATGTYFKCLNCNYKFRLSRETNVKKRCPYCSSANLHEQVQLIRDVDQIGFD